jgi:hypothetical protein
VCAPMPPPGACFLLFFPYLFLHSLCVYVSHIYLDGGGGGGGGGPEMKRFAEGRLLQRAPSTVIGFFFVLSLLRPALAARASFACVCVSGERKEIRQPTRIMEHMLSEY